MAHQKYQPKEYELTPDQAAALDLLLAGHTVTAAAEAVGVSRETVSRWRNNDPAFQAAYNAALQSAHEANQKKLIDARGKALDRLVELVDSEDSTIALRAAAALIRVDVPRPNGETDPAKIESWQTFAGLSTF